ncbi:hypothetical protein SEPCBS119000_005905 [Sporothrix epigloea]|uniref:Px domain containing protein n=1 Tax=Sporothrix epigloea TaxID=1892477 RepID=A0ABP0E0C8_9PEZI
MATSVAADTRPSEPKEFPVNDVAVKHQDALNESQLHALFDILTHHETYREIQDFRDPSTICNYGTPFIQRRRPDSDVEETKTTTEPSSANELYAARSSTPILHMLFNQIVMTLPPAKALPRDFWHTKVQGLISQLAEAELSESYDQGAMGTRKMLATASSALIESLGRGVLGGYPKTRHLSSTEKEDKRLADRTYDTTNAADFAQAWDDVLRAMVYDNLVDELFAYCATHEKDSIEGHSAAVRAAADYIVVHVAEFLHSVFVLSPNGRYLTKLVESLQQLIPYTLVRQTLRVSNAASMINAMMKLLLAKLSVGGLTNWMGLTTSADDGMCLLQRIISLVLSYDASPFKKTAEKVEKDKSSPSGAHPQKKAQLAALREHLARPRSYHEAVRKESASRPDPETGLHKSLVVAALESVDPSLLSPPLTDAQHAQLAQYYAALLSVHDRREITNVLCRQNPDLFTQALRDGMAALDYYIRKIHDKIDLKEHVSDVEGFVNEFIEVTKGTKSSSKKNTGESGECILPTVKDYVRLLRRNRHLLYKWLYRVAHDTPEIRELFRTWAVDTIKLFRESETAEDESARGTSSTANNSRLNGGAGDMNDNLQVLFGRLDSKTQSKVLAQLDQHAAYLCTLDEEALKRRQALLDKIKAPASDDDGQASYAPPTKQAQGSGRFIIRWQELLDDTLIGPATAQGSLRHGRDVAHVATQGKIGASTATTGAGGSGGSISGSPASKSHSRKYDGFFGGLSNALGSHSPSLECLSTPPETFGPGRADTEPRPPDVEFVVEAFGESFRQLLVDRSVLTLPEDKA